MNELVLTSTFVAGVCPSGRNTVPTSAPVACNCSVALVVVPAWIVPVFACA